MKTLLLLMLLTGFPALAQERSPVPYEGASVVAVVSADSGAVVWNRTAKALAHRGYHIRARDSSALRLVAESSQSVGGCHVSIQALVMGHTVLLSARTIKAVPGSAILAIPQKYWSPVSYYSFFAVPFSQREKVSLGHTNISEAGWAELEIVARTLKGQVFYFQHPVRRE